MSIFELLLRAIAPHRCIACQAEGSLLCAGCAKGLQSVPSRCYACQRLTQGFRTCTSCRASSGLYAVQPATVYDGAAKELIHRLKFERAQAAARDAALLMSTRLLLPPGALITYVPTAPARVRQRGYDQAALLAKELSRRTGHAYAPLLARSGSSRQVGQARLVRKRQLQQAFRVVRPAPIQNRHILLVDDVLTTGATCEAAATVLKAAGARRVSALVFAAA